MSEILNTLRVKTDDNDEHELWQNDLGEDTNVRIKYFNSNRKVDVQMTLDEENIYEFVGGDAKKHSYDVTVAAHSVLEVIRSNGKAGPYTLVVVKV